MRLQARAVIAAKAARTIRENARANAKPDIDSQAPSLEQQASDTDEQVKTTVAESGLKLCYWPSWSADSQSIDTFVCRPVGADGGNPFDRTDSALVAANSVAVTRAGVVSLSGMIKNGVRAKLIIPVPLAVILSPVQRHILQALHKLQDAHRFLYLRPEIVCIPSSVSTAALLTARDILRPISRDVGVLTDLHDPNKAVLTASKVIIGCDAGSRTALSTAALIEELAQFKESVRDRPAYVVGLPNMESLKAAANLGFVEIGGPGFRAPLRRALGTTEPLPRQDLLANLD